MYFAKTRASFEEIALKFMEVDEKTALLNFLKKRLEQVRHFEKNFCSLIERRWFDFETITLELLLNWIIKVCIGK
jgi:hypothetical protein